MKLIQLTRGLFAKVDDSDFDFLNRFSWQAIAHREKFKVQGWVNGRNVSMHRLLMKFPSEGVDHKNCDSLDNQRHNLRVATNSQNQANRGPEKCSSSGFKGIHLKRGKSRLKRPWAARLYLNNIPYHLGAYETPEEAATAYAFYALAAYGEFARFEA